MGRWSSSLLFLMQLLTMVFLLELWLSQDSCYDSLREGTSLNLICLSMCSISLGIKCHVSLINLNWLVISLEVFPDTSMKAINSHLLLRITSSIPLRSLKVTRNLPLVQNHILLIVIFKRVQTKPEWWPTG